MEPNNSPQQAPEPVAPEPEYQPLQPAPSVAPAKKKKGKLIAIIVILVVLIAAGAAAFYFLRTKKPAANNANTVIKYADTFAKKDASGEYDKFYRRNAATYKDAAKKISFDLYDTSYETKDVGLSARVAGVADSERPASLHLTYSTLVKGAFQPFQEQWDLDRVAIYEFNVADIPGHTSNCGPAVPELPKYDFTTTDNNKRECIKTAHTFQGQPVYESESDSFSGAGPDGQAVLFRAYTVNVGNTRVVVNASKNDESLAFTILDSMKKANPDQMDFFLKDGSTPD
jgi:uncharacterized protein YxeA